MVVIQQTLHKATLRIASVDVVAQVTLQKLA